MRFGFATLDEEGLLALTRWTRRVHLWDIMCGNGQLADALFRQAATNRPLSVESCDKAWEVRPKAAPWRVHSTAYVVDWRPTQQAATALLSWPVNWHVPGLVPLLHRCARVVYIGSNIDGTACGDAALWTHLSARPVIDAVAGPQGSTLIVFGSPLVDTARAQAVAVAAQELRAATELLHE